MDSVNACLLAFYLCDLLDKAFAAGTGIPCFWQTVFQFTLGTKIQLQVNDRKECCHTQAQ
jgi:hypothetical protein